MAKTASNCIYFDLFPTAIRSRTRTFVGTNALEHNVRSEKSQRYWLDEIDNKEMFFFLYFLLVITT